MAGATRTLRLVSAFRVAVVPAGTEGRDIPAAQKRLRLTQYLSVSARTDSYPTGQELTGNSLVSYPATQFNRSRRTDSSGRLGFRLLLDHLLRQGHFKIHGLPDGGELEMVWTIRKDCAFGDHNLCTTAKVLIHSKLRVRLAGLRHRSRFLLNQEVGDASRLIANPR